MEKKNKVMTNKIVIIILDSFINLGIKCFLKNTSIKLIKYYNFINYNLIYNNKAINRYKKDNYEITENKSKNLEFLKNSLLKVKIIVI